MDLKEIGINTRNWVDSAQDRDYWRILVNIIIIIIIIINILYNNCPYKTQIFMKILIEVQVRG